MSLDLRREALPHQADHHLRGGAHLLTYGKVCYAALAHGALRAPDGASVPRLCVPDAAPPRSSGSPTGHARSRGVDNDVGNDKYTHWGPGPASDSDAGPGADAGPPVR